MKISTTIRHASPRFRTRKSERPFEDNSDSSKTDLRTSYLLSFCRADDRRYLSVAIQQNQKSYISGRQEAKSVSIDDLIHSKNTADKLIGLVLKEAVVVYKDRYFLMNAKDLTGIVLESMIETGNCFKVINGQKVKVETINDLRPSRNEDVEVEEIFTKPTPVLKKTQITIDNNFKSLIRLGHKPGTKVDTLQLLIKYDEFEVNPAPNSSDGSVPTGAQKLIRETGFEKATIKKLEKQGLFKVVKREGQKQDQGNEMFFVLPANSSCRFTKFFGLLLPSVEKDIKQSRVKKQKSSVSKLAKAV